MRPHTKKLSAIGTAIGLVLMASAVTPAMAAKPAPPAPTVASSYSCSYFKGLTSTEASVVVNGVALTAGDKITVNVNPARSGDEINFTPSIFGSTSIIFLAAPATSGLTYTAPVTGVYYLPWSLDTSANGTRPVGLTWSFTATCSSTSVTSPSPSPSPTATTKPGKGKKK